MDINKKVKSIVCFCVSPEVREKGVASHLLERVCEDAVRREILEETGYHCEIVNELGYVYENRAHCDFEQYSYYYIAKALGSQSQICMDECERESKMEVQGHTLEKVFQFIVTPVHDTIQKKFIQAKDTAALYEYVKSIS